MLHETLGKFWVWGVLGPTLLASQKWVCLPVPATLTPWPVGSVASTLTGQWTQSQKFKPWVNYSSLRKRSEWPIFMVTLATNSSKTSESSVPTTRETDSFPIILWKDLNSPAGFSAETCPNQLNSETQCPMWSQRHGTKSTPTESSTGDTIVSQAVTNADRKNKRSQRTSVHGTCFMSSALESWSL